MAGAGAASAALAGVATVPFWLDTPARPAARAALSGPVHCDLAVIGGGYTGLWTAVRAKERDPGRNVLLIEADQVGHAASGRNGGFCAASLTHGESNGRSRFPDEYPQLDRLGRQNLDEIEATMARYDIDCDFRAGRELAVATEPYQVDGLREGSGEFLDADAVRKELDSPTYLAGRWDRRSVALVDPARLAWGLADVAERLGVRIVEHTPALGLDRDGDTVVLRTAAGPVRADQVALATNAYTPLLRRLRLYTVPVYDHVLASEPLDADQLRSDRMAAPAGGGRQRQPVPLLPADRRQPHRLGRLRRDLPLRTPGAAALRRQPGHVAHPRRELLHHVPATGRAAVHPRLGRVDRHLHPVLRVLGTALAGKVAYVLGYTGLGVGASRFGADVMLDLLAGQPTERTELDFVRRRPLPFPPEPLAYVGIQATRWSLARADRREGRRNLWLRTLDRAGLGFDS